jgi:dihydrolipoamide dehydrogenase
VAAVDVLRKCRNAEAYGIRIEGPIQFDLETLVKRKNKVVENLVKGVHALFKRWKIDLYEGTGILQDRNTIRVKKPDGAEVEIGADKVILATGSKPASIPQFPYDNRDIFSSDWAVDMPEVPASLLIVGAGVIGCEFACIFSELGSIVTMVELLDRVLPLEDGDISKLFARELKKKKIKAVTGTKVAAVKKDPGGALLSTLENGDEIRTDKMLVSVGRVPNVEGLGLETLGVEQGRGGFIKVNARMETNVEGIYAAGDVVGGMMLAHVAAAEGLVAVESALGKDKEISYDVVPSGIFTHPEIGTVGLKEEEAKEKGLPVKIGRFQYRLLGKAHAIDEIAGEVKIIAEAATDRVLGVHILGAHAADLVHEGALAIRHGLKASDLAGMIHAHPTLSEAIQEAAHDVHGLAIHQPKSGK